MRGLDVGLVHHGVVHGGVYSRMTEDVYKRQVVTWRVPIRSNFQLLKIFEKLGRELLKNF